MEFAEDLALWHEMKGDLYLDEVRFGAPRDSAERDALKLKAIEAYQEAYTRKPNLAILTKWTDAGLSLTAPNYKAIIAMLEPMTAQLDIEPMLRVLFEFPEGSR